MLPPGQKLRADFPRFGLSQFATRFPSNLADSTFNVHIDGRELPQFDPAAAGLPRCTLESDFHCVTTWSYAGANWSGVRFIDFYEKHIRPEDNIDNPVTGAVLYAQDGAKTTLPLEDLLRDNVLLADSLDGQPLSVEHGAPVRLIAPDHYGYKNLKHMRKIEFYSTMPVVKRGVMAFLDHPRARVAKEERGRWIPGWMLRYLYRPLIGGTVKEFREGMRNYRGDGSGQ